MKDNSEPKWVCDGLIVHRNVTVYVCDADDPQVNGFDVHLNVGDNDGFDHIMFDNTATLYDRGTLGESWGDASEWMRDTADALSEFASWIDAHMDELGAEADE